ncbi:MAG: hypothetical protein JXB50_04415 [Spirochaetes bacterium]|nr:hypothetical protein [Spirochaetota bacterium]
MVIFIFAILLTFGSHIIRSLIIYPKAGKNEHDILNFIDKQIEFHRSQQIIYNQLNYLKTNYIEEREKIQHLEKKYFYIKENIYNELKSSYNFEDLDYIQKEIDCLNKNSIFQFISFKIGFIILLNFILLTLLSVIFSYFLIKHANFIFLKQKKDLKIPIYPFFIFFFVIFILHLIHDFYQNFFKNSQILYSWTSFCISIGGWIFTQLSYLGLTMICVYPFSILFVYSSKKYLLVLNKEQLIKTNNIEDYILFLQTWCIAGLIIGVVPVIFIIQIYQNSNDNLFPITLFLEISAILSIIFLIIFRLILRALNIKLWYHSKIKKKYNKDEVPPDPSIIFLGEKWWSFPASILFIIGSIWAFIKFIGIVDFISKQIK